MKKNKGKGAVVLDVQESDSRPGLKHEIRLGGDSRVYCTCEAWRWGRGKPCKHVKRYAAKLRKAA